MNAQMKTLMYQRIFNPSICRILYCNLLERIVPYRTWHSGSDDHRH